MRQPEPTSDEWADLDRWSRVKHAVDRQKYDPDYLGSDGFRAMKELVFAASEWMHEQCNPRSTPWIPCSDRLPEHGQRVLAFLADCDWPDPRVVAERTTMHDYTKNRDVPGWSIHDDGCNASWLEDDQVSHWQPLPEPPQ